MGQLIGGLLNEEADLQQTPSLFISHVVLIYNNTAVENMRPVGLAKTCDALQVERLVSELAQGARRLPSDPKLFMSKE